MCAPDLENMEANDTSPESTLAHWTDHIDKAIHSMNDRILLALGFTPRELLWGRREATGRHAGEGAMAETMEEDTAHHFILADSLRSQGYTESLAEAA